MMERRTLVRGAAAALLAPALTPAWVGAQDFPSKPVRWIVPYAAGGPNDAIARKLAEMASQRMGQPIVIDNKPGASGSVGTRELMASAPDGYTLGIAIPDSLVSAPFILRSARYDARSDFSPVIQIADARGRHRGARGPGRCDHGRRGAHRAREKPGTIAYASLGPGSRCRTWR